jgi:hypothetical protein
MKLADLKEAKYAGGDSKLVFLQDTDVPEDPLIGPFNSEKEALEFAWFINNKAAPGITATFEIKKVNDPRHAVEEYEEAQEKYVDMIS